MTRGTKRIDIFDEFTGTGVGGRMADVLSASDIKTDMFSIDGQQVLLIGEPGMGPSQYVLSSSGLPDFNRNPSIDNMTEVIGTLNNGATSGFFSKTWSDKLTQSLDQNVSQCIYQTLLYMNQFVCSLSYVTSTLQQLLKEEVDATVVTTEFPDSSTAEEFAMIVSYVCNYQYLPSRYI